jgi:periplasmic protein TonB
MEAAFEKNNRLLSLAGTLLIAAVLFITLLFIEFITPIPPFEESPMGGLEVNFGFDDAGREKNNSLTPVANNKTQSEASPSAPSSPNDLLTSAEETNVTLPPVKHTKKEAKEIKEVVKEDPKPDQDLVNALNKVTSNTGVKSGDGNGNSPGNQGDPSGTLNANVYSDFGGGTGGVYGKLKGSGRKMIGDLAIYDDSQETGTVAVEILVDRTGKIIKAEPVLMGSTTTSTLLWRKAKEGLLHKILFNKSPTGEEARGTIYINFTVR